MNNLIRNKSIFFKILIFHILFYCSIIFSINFVFYEKNNEYYENMNLKTKLHDFRKVNLSYSDLFYLNDQILDCILFYCPTYKNKMVKNIQDKLSKFSFAMVGGYKTLDYLFIDKNLFLNPRFYNLIFFIFVFNSMFRKLNKSQYYYKIKNNENIIEK